MAVTSQRSTRVIFSGDVSFDQTFAAASNSVAPGKIEKINLSSGANTITVPSAGGATAKAVVIIPPSGNTNTITLKGVTGDTGVLLHKTDPAIISLDSVSSFVLTAGASITGVTFIWS